ncbi:single-stranded-DNA-specific exonuclease RecJ [Helicobacter sp. 11S03491-1]|uniref:single-stranded-DNA-specific exonuclease RecJ n=1 Tax=Helicobacter sp. 11S03491-1 TaxID=1476196 RepID=UPI000BA7128A|nr:single-stranded-DNA-specific exonuclease RecJ [Helicobacter sp. 11S03491-1]PAF41317.1 single-stranded-DNA-specific exonuclease RecJ [Helicobacter sp. 11S03491-1]
MNPSLNKQTIQQLLAQRFKDDIFVSPSQLPHPHKLKDAQNAAIIITQAIKEDKKILIVGDYDVDGITSTALMMRFFSLIDYPNISYVIPNRFSDGYGVSQSILEKNPADIVITVDNGISAFECGEYCLQKGIIFIITDHHSIKDKLPQANAIINPQQTQCLFPQKEICGAAVAWYLCNAIKIELGLKISLIDLLDFVCIATIADMMPLTKVNKLLVKIGLKKFQDSNSPANKALKRHLKTKNIIAADIAHYIAPLINSAGRMGDANIALQLLLSNNEQEAAKFYKELYLCNNERKTIAKDTLLLAQETSLISKNCILAYGENWHEGVLGIVAATLAQSYQRPAIVLSKKEDILKGSARSYDNIDLIETFNAHSEFFIQFGGHTKAVGLQINQRNLEPFFESLKNFQMPQVKQAEISETLGVLNLEEIDGELLRILDQFEPYGQGNPQPHFTCNNLTIASAQTLKALHQKLEFDVYNRKQKAMVFFCEKFYEKNDQVNINFSVQKDSFSNCALMIVKTIQKCPL